MLSVVISAWNEEKNLPRAVASVKSFADEIIVVDTESTDSTVSVAKKLGCRVFKHKNTGIVEPVRNFSISKAKGDWILLLDADEEIPQALSKIIQAITTNPKGDYYRIPRKNIIFNHWIKSSHWWPDYVYRLFKRGFVSWEDTIHSIPHTRGIGIDISPDENCAIIHHNYSSVSQYVDRLNRYTDYQVDFVLQNGYNFSWQDIISKPAKEFISQYFARQAYKDGLHGLVLSLLQSFSELVLYLKLWQQSGFVETQISLARLNTAIRQQYNDLKWWYYQTRIDSSPFYLKLFWKIFRKLGL